MALIYAITFRADITAGIELGLYGVRQLVYLLAYSSVILTTVAVGAFLCTLSMPAMQLALAL